MGSYASAVRRGTRAAQPLASAVVIGALYFVTDEKVWERSTGAAWEDCSALKGLATSGVGFIIDGGGVVITTGVKGDLQIPFACTITGVVLLADQVGSIVIDIWKDSYANYPPVVGDSICAAAKPTLAAAAKSEDNTLTGWIVAIAAGDTLRFNVDSIATITRCSLILKVTR